MSQLKAKPKITPVAVQELVEILLDAEGNPIKQHPSPCGECPWGRKATPGRLGGSPPEVYIGQVVGPFWLPCHEAPKYAWKQSNVNKVQECAGAAIFRSNIGVAPASGLLSLPADKEKVFADPAEFVAHHSGNPVEIVRRLLTEDIILKWAEIELGKQSVQYHFKKRSQRS